MLYLHRNNNKKLFYPLNKIYQQNYISYQLVLPWAELGASFSYLAVSDIGRKKPNPLLISRQKIIKGFHACTAWLKSHHSISMRSRSGLWLSNGLSVSMSQPGLSGFMRTLWVIVMLRVPIQLPVSFFSLTQPLLNCVTDFVNLTRSCYFVFIIKNYILRIFHILMFTMFSICPTEPN